MDPLTHTLTGAAISRTGLGRATPLATAVLIVAANAPDVDIVVGFLGPYASLAYRRGWTHGPLAMLLLPFVVTGAFLMWDRFVRRRRNPSAARIRPRGVLLLSILGVLTHPMLDWMNTYGIRLGMPFVRDWFYGDALFIIDPWLWLLLTGGVFLTGGGSHRGRIGWAILATAASLLILAGPVPVPARWLWAAGILMLGVFRAAGVGRYRGGPETTARVSVGLVAGYIVLMVASDVLARRAVRQVADAALIVDVRSVMVAPRPADPLTASIVIATPTAYHFGEFRWLRRPQVRLDADTIAILPPDDITRAAAETEAAKRFLTWSRYPFFAVREDTEGFTVRIGDARYVDEAGARELAGLTVRLDRELRPVAP